MAVTNTFNSSSKAQAQNHKRNIAGGLGADPRVAVALYLASLLVATLEVGVYPSPSVLCPSPFA